MSACLRVCPVVGHADVCVCVCVVVCFTVRPLYIDTTTTYMHCYHLRTPYTPFTPTHGCCGSRRMLYPLRSARDPYCMRTVSVLPLCLDFRPDPQSNFESDFISHVCCGRADKVSRKWLVLCPSCPRRHPYSVHSVRTLSADQVNFNFNDVG